MRSRAACWVPSVVLALALGLLAALVPSGGHAAAPQPEGDRAWFGPVLDPQRDSLPAYAERLGRAPSLVTVELAYPLDDGARELLRTVGRDAARAGAVLVVDARPTESLSALGPADAGGLVRAVATLQRDRGTEVLVRFAPEMNGSWETWGQQPRDYVSAFRMLADALHAETEAGTVWAPVYGSGYPFRASDGADGALGEVLERDRPALDTDDDGRLDSSDDPYAPYYPGDEAVDWVGLSAYRLGQSQALRRNVELPAAELRLRLQERWGYGDDRERTPFLDRFAATGQPLLLETAAPYNPEVGGAPELTVKRQWWRQLFAVVDADPRIGAASWLEVRRTEPEVADVEVDWRVTADPGTARELLRDLRRSTRLQLAPVYETRDRDSDLVTPEPAGPAPGAEPTLEATGASPAWWWLGTGALMLLAVVVGLLAPRWREVDDEERDPRLDVVRGGVLLGTVVALVLTLGLGLGSLTPWLVVGGVGTLLVVSGAGHQRTELRVADLGGGPAAVSAHLRRALVLYLAALVLTVLHLLLDAAPGVTSPFGSYDDAALLLEYPPPGDAATDLLTLRIAPGPVALLGLFAVLSVLAAVLGPVVRRGAGWLVLGGSWAVFAVGLQTGAHLSALGWEAGWPLLVWQLPFVHGLVLTDLALTREDAFPRVAGSVLAVLGLAAVGWGALVLPGLVPSSQPAVVVALLSAAALLGVTWLAWRPLGRALGWLGLVGRRPLSLGALAVLAVLGASLV